MKQAVGINQKWHNKTDHAWER